MKLRTKIIAENFDLEYETVEKEIEKIQRIEKVSYRLASQWYLLLFGYESIFDLPILPKKIME